MGILVETSVVQPQVEFNKIHLLRLEIKQPIYETAREIPLYSVWIEYKLFGEANGKHVYHPDVYEIEIPDYLSLALQENNAGDSQYLEAFAAIEKTIAALIAREQGVSAEVI